MLKRTILPLALLATGLVACGQETETTNVDPGKFSKSVNSKGDASAEAVFLDLEFSGELLTDSTWNINKQIEEQMLYTVGQLNGENSVGRLDKLDLTNVETRRAEDGKTRVTYDAKLLVAWGQKDDVPDEYTFQLPLDVSFEGQEAFTESYSHDCVDWGAHDVTSGSMWYYYRPNGYRCELNADDIVELTANVTVSDVNTTGKYPEYHKVWEDDELKVVAVFGKYEDDATTSSDAGISAYNRFVRTMKNDLGALDNFRTVPEDVPDSPGIESPDITFRAEMGDGQSVEVVALLVDNIRTAGRGFDQRYSELSGPADLVAYNGHSGLGSNIRALAQKGSWVPGQYSIVFMNGCDTYAYVDSALNDARAQINPDDDTGTKYLDIVTNAMPSFFSEMDNGTTQLIRGLMNVDDPQTFEQMFTRFDSNEVVLVSGEQDNEYVPGADDGGDPMEDWGGFDEAGRVERSAENRYATPTLPEGTYTFAISGDNDADLYVRVGNEPTTEMWDCRPYKMGSEETCQVELGAPTTIHVMVRGWAGNSNYTLVGRRD